VQAGWTGVRLVDSNLGSQFSERTSQLQARDDVCPRGELIGCGAALSAVSSPAVMDSRIIVESAAARRMSSGATCLAEAG
jgi:hypothetical protein